MNGFPLLAGALAALIGADANASILDAFNSGNVITDFTFDDPQGTQIPDTANSGSAGGSFDSDADSAAVVTNGIGQLDASAKANTEFGSNYVDIPAIPAGRVIGLFDVSWDFQTPFDPSQEEEFRLTLIRDDPRATFVTAEIFFERTGETEVTLFGNGVGSGSSDSPDIVFGASGDLLTLIDVDLDADTFELWYSADDGASFTSGGTGTIDPTRGIESVRLVINEDYTGDSLLVDRFAVSFIPEPATATIAVLAGVPLLARQRRR